MILFFYKQMFILSRLDDQIPVNDFRQFDVGFKTASSTV